MKLQSILRRRGSTGGRDRGEVPALDLGFSFDHASLKSVDLPKGPYTQVSALERALLYSLGAHTVTGAGQVVELGPGAGGSTLALCAGLRSNPRFSGTVHVFDYFRTGKGTYATTKFLTDPGSGNASFLEGFKENLSGHLDMLAVHSGDLCEADLSGVGEIELLHVDIAKTLDTFSCVVRGFFPRLIPGVSIALHQDFAGPRLSWLHYSTGALLPYIELFGSPVRSTLPFRLLDPIPTEVVDRIVADDFTPREKVRLIGKVQERLGNDISGGVPFGSILELSKAFVMLYADKPAEAWRIAEPLRADPYLSRTRADHFDQIRRARDAAG